MDSTVSWLIVIVILLIVLFPLVVNSFTRSTLGYLESEIGPREEGFSGGPWYNYTNIGNGGQVFNSLALDFSRNLVFLTRGAHTRVEKIHSIAGGSMDDRFSPYYFPTKSWYVLSFGPNLDSLRLYQPTCGILEVQINNEKPIQMYSKLSAAAKFPSTDVMYAGGLIYAPNNIISEPPTDKESFEISSVKDGADAVIFPERLNTTEMPFSASYIACRPPILPLIPKPASAAAVSSRELSTLS